MTQHDSDPDLPQLDAEEEQRLATLLKSAFAPLEIEPARHERLLLALLEDPFATPSPEEVVESERLRRALDGDGDHPQLVLARALAAAFAPSGVPPKVVPPATRTTTSRPAKVFYVRFGGVLAAFAAAAAVLFMISPRNNRPEASAPELPALALVQSRSTAALFQTASVGPPSARIDRIASVRERDLRANRYAMWGVR